MAAACSFARTPCDLSVLRQQPVRRRASARNASCCSGRGASDECSGVQRESCSSPRAKEKVCCRSDVKETGSSPSGRRALLSVAGLSIGPLLAESQGNMQAWAAPAHQVAATLEESMAAEGIVPVDPANYVPSPIEVGWEIWFGAFAGAFPFAIGLYEFTKRIMIQRRCERCRGTGLVIAGEQSLEVKCPQCGGFFPWRSWSEFLSANARPGNGGVLRQPKGQTSVFYKVPERPDWQKDDKAKSISSNSSNSAQETVTASSDDNQQP